MAPRLDVVGLVVKHMSATLAFYRRLGLMFADGAEKEGHVETALPGGLRLVFDTIEIIHSFNRDWVPPTGGHRVALAFACASPTEVDELHRELVATGHDGHLATWDAFWGQRYASVHDPDGNAVELFADLADHAS